MSDFDQRLETPVSLAGLATRLLIYILMGAALALMPTLDLEMGLRDLHDQYFSEYSVLEIGQKLALAMALVIVATAAHRGWIPELHLLLAAMICCALTRELDYLFDFWFDGAWQLTMTVILIATVIWFWPRRVLLTQQASQLVHHFSFGLLLAGSMIVLGFSRVFGRGDYWREFLGEHYDRSVKNLAEESMELLGFWIVTVGVAELALAARRTYSRRSRVARSGPSVGAS